ncbi:MAG: hypothetical protein ABIH42_11110 [Planctomycetota bacterium]
MPQALLLIVIVAVIIGVVSLYCLYIKKRREALSALAKEIGLSYSPKDLFNIPRKFGHLSMFQHGDSRRAYDVLFGEKDGAEVYIFNYIYYTGSGKNRHAHTFTNCVLRGKDRFPYLILRPESFLDKMASFIGFDDIDFESAKFSKKFFVKSRDRKFAYDVIHPQMMEFLLAVSNINVEIGEREFLFHFNRTLIISEWASLCKIGFDFIGKIPNYAGK